MKKIIPIIVLLVKKHIYTDCYIHIFSEGFESDKKAPKFKIGGRIRRISIKTFLAKTTLKKG